jgi:tetratricopeptide (TPR) repeat protein
MTQDSRIVDIADLIKAPVRTMSDADAIDCIAKLIDLSGDARSERGIKRAFGMLKEIGRRNLTPAQQAMLHYFRANACSSKHQMEGSPGPREWEQPDRQEQILALFMARNHEGFAGLDKVRRCQILTNLGNQFNQVGRFVEAIELWDSALEIPPNFAMAHGSRGSGLKWYGLVSEDGYDPTWTAGPDFAIENGRNTGG